MRQRGHVSLYTVSFFNALPWRRVGAKFHKCRVLFQKLHRLSMYTIRHFHRVQKQRASCGYVELWESSSPDPRIPRNRRGLSISSKFMHAQMDLADSFRKHLLTNRTRIEYNETPYILSFRTFLFFSIFFPLEKTVFPSSPNQINIFLLLH